MVRIWVRQDTIIGACLSKFALEIDLSDIFPATLLWFICKLAGHWTHNLPSSSAGHKHPAKADDQGGFHLDPVHLTFASILYFWNCGLVWVVKIWKFYVGGSWCGWMLFCYFQIKFAVVCLSVICGIMMIESDL